MKNANAQQVLEEARRAVDEYLKKNAAPKRRPGERLWGAIFVAAGALAAGIAWLTMRFVGV